MTGDELQQLLALEALGALDGPEREQARTLLDHDPAAARESARFRDVAAGLAMISNPVQPSSAVRERVLARVRQTRQIAREGAGVSQPLPGRSWPQGFWRIGPEAPWVAGPVPGTRFKLLSAPRSEGYAMLLLELAAGAVHPEHHHPGAEELFVLTGDLQTEGNVLGPGDFLHAEPGSHHHELRSRGGCTAILVMPRRALAEVAAG